MIFGKLKAKCQPLLRTLRWFIIFLKLNHNVLRQLLWFSGSQPPTDVLSPSTSCSSKIQIPHNFVCQRYALPLFLESFAPPHFPVRHLILLQKSS